MADLTHLPQAPAGCLSNGVTDQHGTDAFEVRFGTATQEATKTSIVPHSTDVNGLSIQSPLIAADSQHYGDSVVPPPPKLTSKDICDQTY
jgi:hypothetical protein